MKFKIHDNLTLDDKIYKEIREKMPGQYLDVFSNWNSVKLDGTYSMDELKHIIEVFKKYEIQDS